MREDSHPLRIVVIDDNHDAADSLARIMKLWGHEAWKAYDGPSGLATALVYRPDVILLDVSLPGLDGFQLIAALRARSACNEALLISVSAHNDFDLLTRLYESGINEHFPKPVNLIALKTLLEKHASVKQVYESEPPGEPPLLSKSHARLQYIREILRRTADDHLFVSRLPGDVSPSRLHGRKGRAL
jgi:CheY-like chemotaxis protein